MCPACGGRGAEPLLSKDGFRYMECRDCGSARLDPLPHAAPHHLYGRDYFEGAVVAGGYTSYGADEELHRRNARSRLALMRRGGAVPPGQMLELGSGYGFFLDEAQSQGWNVAGVDISEHAREMAGRLGLEVSAHLQPSETTADVFAAFQVLEHMPDPDEALAEGVGQLAPGGLLVVETWDRSHWAARLFGRHWQQISPPSVLHLFTDAGLRTLAARLGLCEVTVEPTPKLVSIGAVAGQLATRFPAWDPVLSRARDSALGKWALRYGFGDLVTLTARKPR